MFQYIPPPNIPLDSPAIIREIEDKKIVNITCATPISKPLYADVSHPPLSKVFAIDSNGNFIHGVEELSKHIKKIT